MSPKSDQDFTQRRNELINSANQIFDKMRKIVEDEGRQGQPLSVRDIAQRAGLEISESTLTQMGVALSAQPMTFLSWDAWFPFRALWAYYWKTNLPSSPAARSWGGPSRAVANVEHLVGSMDMP